MHVNRERMGRRALALWWATWWAAALLGAPAAGRGGRRVSLCSSWRLNVEVDNIKGWTLVPSTCEAHVAAYMTGSAYVEDSQCAMDQALDYARPYNTTTSSSSYVWVFDVDETSLSNLPFYALHDFGATAYDSTLFLAWAEEASAPALPASLHLFTELRQLGFLVFFLTGRGEDQRNITVSNLKAAGYSGWEGLILRQSEDQGTSAVVYKSKKRKALEDLGYVIVGNVGDQWSDLTGYSVGARVFKLPNPMYYIS